MRRLFDQWSQIALSLTLASFLVMPAVLLTAEYLTSSARAAERYQYEIAREPSEWRPGIRDPLGDARDDAREALEELSPTRMTLLKEVFLRGKSSVEVKRSLRYYSHALSVQHYNKIPRDLVHQAKRTLGLDRFEAMKRKYAGRRPSAADIEAIARELMLTPERLLNMARSSRR